ncbi:OmpA family protein [Catalinimonas niigatensis]|uniref:OmpA family protein n=1 Tax=Catalinimonas niigatensis TaxID=1397264 RepID=UPI0026655465|nr:OmpA family protein [Catalinimonas niigatensis]WPP49607.1 OmpA family protein [Catalinimonas niigatensis]
MRICHIHLAKLQRRTFFYLALSSCFFILGLADLSAQQLARADAFFEAQQYYTASSIYKDIVSQDTTHYHAAFKLAHCYRHLFDYRKAENYYGLVAQNAAQNFPLSLYYYAQILKYNQKYEEAISWYEQFLKRPHELTQDYRKQAEREKQGCIQAMLEQPSAEGKIQLIRLPEPINTAYQEFAPAIYRHDSLLAFSSSRVRNDERVSNRSGEGFSDQYLVEQDSIQWQDISDAGRFEKLNSKWADASGSFTADGSKYYFTHCSPSSGLCSIYVSEWSQDKWQEAELLSQTINLAGSNSKQPSVSSEGDTLFFVSDRPGGQGGTDIWMSRLGANGDWQPALPLGEEINTAQDEISPFYSSKNSLLVFASDGRQGLGGMDLYMANINTDVKNTAIALPSPFNSSKDDCYLVFGSNNGYMASNREGNFDIYGFKKKANQSFQQFLQGMPADLLTSIAGKGKVFDEIISDYSVLLNHDEEDMTVMRSSGQDYLRNGSSRFVLSSDVKDIRLEQLRDEKALSQGTSISVSPTNSADTLADKNLLISFSTYQVSDQEMVEIRGTIINKDQNLPVTTLSLYLLDEEGNINKITTTNAQGEFRFVNLEASTSYQIRSAGDQNQQNLGLENLRVFGYGEDFTTLKFENIYFDFNQAYLRNEARVALDQLAAIYQQYPSSVIEINAFTDSTGNDVYNLQLSRERGQAAFDYLLEKGVDRSSLVFNAKGVSTAIVSSNSYISQQLNRRIEFYVTGRDLLYKSEIVTRMLRPQVTLYTLANETGMSLEEIKSLNGISGNELQAYKPIRIYQWAFEKAPGLFYQMQVRSE